MSDNNVKVQLPNQTLEFNLEENKFINLEIANINGEIYINNKPIENISSNVGNGFTKIGLEDNEVNEEELRSKNEYYSSIHKILSKQNNSDNVDNYEADTLVAENQITDENNLSRENENTEENLVSNNDNLVDEDESIDDTKEVNEISSESDENTNNKDSFENRYMPLDDEDEDE